MGWLEIVLVIAVAVILLVKFGFLPPPHATLLIRIHGDQLILTRGRLRAQSREFIADILREACVAHGFIAVTPEKWVAFSHTIPKRYHQRLRNVLLNT
jgi:hypothetical protein